MSRNNWNKRLPGVAWWWSCFFLTILFMSVSFFSSRDARILASAQNGAQSELLVKAYLPVQNPRKPRRHCFNRILGQPIRFLFSGNPQIQKTWWYLRGWEVVLPIKHDIQSISNGWHKHSTAVTIARFDPKTFTFANLEHAIEYGKIHSNLQRC